jgi:hypothetical protein
MKALRKPQRGAFAPAIACALLAALSSLLLAADALAAGSFKLRSPTVSEVSGGWHVFCDVALPKPPLTPHVTLKFLFTKTAVYERDLVDNSPKPVVNRQALVGQQPSVESLEVDFADASGKIYNITHFDFSLTRVRGYEAGEYKLQVRTSDGLDIGSATTITLNGDNPVVDRRAMSFDAKNPNMKKVSSGVDAGVAKVDDTVAAVPQNTEVAPAGSAPPFIPPEAFQKQPEEIGDHPKGCGCDVPGASGDNTPLTRALGALGVGLGLSLIAWRKRRTHARVGGLAR